MNREQLQDRTKQFALRIIRLAQELMKTETGRIIGKQVLRSGTSVAANYRATARSRSKAEFVSKLGIVEKEADETLFWLELIVESKLIRPERVNDLKKEANEILAIMAASRKTAKTN